MIVIFKLSRVLKNKAENICWNVAIYLVRTARKVPKCEMFERLDFHDFYTREPSWVADFGLKI
jgi:hypothetical protein